MSEYLSDIGQAFILVSLLWLAVVLLNSVVLLFGIYHTNTHYIKVFETSSTSLVRSWILVPFGIVLMLLACFGVDVVFKSAGVSFPASVACLILLFFALLMSEWLLGGNRTRRIVAVIDVPVSKSPSSADNYSSDRTPGRLGATLDQRIFHPYFRSSAAEPLDLFCRGAQDHRCVWYVTQSAPIDVHINVD